MQTEEIDVRRNSVREKEVGIGRRERRVGSKWIMHRKIHVVISIESQGILIVVIVGGVVARLQERADIRMSEVYITPSTLPGRAQKV